MKETSPKILLVDYYGICDEKGEELGHSSKVLVEYAKLLQSNYFIDACVSPCLISRVKQNNEINALIPLKYNIVNGESNSFGKRLIDKLKLFKNYRSIPYNGYDQIWFYKIDFFLILFMLFCGNRKILDRTIVLTYQTDYGNRFLNKIYNMGLNRIGKVIYTQKKTQINHSNSFFMPDYYFDINIYGKYLKKNKKEFAVCLGTMNYYKEIEHLIDTFNENQYPLVIKGKFYSKNEYEKLREKAGSNIVIENAILSTDEYYQLLSEAKYSILPYNMDQYSERTSGVLYETIFLQTIPVAPRLLLLNNGVNGIAYDNWNNFPLAWNERDRKNSVILDNFDVIVYKDDLQNEFLKFMLK